MICLYYLSLSLLFLTSMRLLILIISVVEFLSALPGGRISKLQDLLLNTVKPSTLHVVESKIQFLVDDLSAIGLDISG